MDEELIAALRQVLQEEILPELRALGQKLEDFHRNVEESTTALAQRFEAVRQEMVATRAELVQLRKELRATRDEVFGSPQSSRLIH